MVVNKFSTIESRIQALYEISQLLLEKGRIISDENHLFSKEPARKAKEEPSFIAEINDEVSESAETTNWLPCLKSLF